MSATAFASLIGYMLACSFTPGPGNILALTLPAHLVGDAVDT